MTFTPKDLAHFGCDPYDMVTDEHGNIEMCYCTGLTEFACRAFDVDLTHDYPDGWIDVRAYCKDGIVEELVFSTDLHDSETVDRELDLTLNDRDEGRRLYAILEKEQKEF